MIINKDELLVRAYLQSRGFHLNNPKNQTANGVDIFAMKNGEFFSFEVKRAINSSRCWKVLPVLKSGSKSDYIAIVAGEDILIQPMEDHLKLCSKSGYRFITKHIKFLKMAASL